MEIKKCFLQVVKQTPYRSVFFLLTAFCLLLTFPSFAQKPVPELWGTRVHDDAHALKQSTVDELEKKLKVYEDSTSNQIAILLVSTLDGDAIEDYALRVVEKWKLGQQGKDNGVLLMVAVDDHKMRIEVGQGLEGVLTDAQTNRIIRNDIAPNFRRDDYDAGVLAGIDGIIKSMGGEYTANDADGGFDMVTRIVVGFAVFLILGVFTAVALALLEGRAVWWAYAGLMPFYIAFPWIAIGVIGGIILFVIYAIGFPLAQMWIKRSSKNRSSSMSKISRSESSSSSSNFGSSSSSSWTSSSSSGSSFSGGGGSFGGGGSSGSW